MMKYLVLLIGEGEAGDWMSMTEAEQGAAMEQFESFDAACAEREGVQIISGEALGSPDTMTVMRTRAGTVELTDGPYAEVVEGLGGFYLIEAPDLDVLIELLEVLPDFDIQISPAVDPT